MGYLEFQFPTGQNSTVLLCKVSKALTSFNSQRDRILPYLISPQPPNQGVSIPNGIEFYKRLLLCPIGSSFVSIPNGIEFYFNPNIFKLRLNGFNSQRDRILRKGATHTTRLSCFNSQRDRILLKLNGGKVEPMRFQFPTGQNSTKKRCKKPPQSLSFNSQRDRILHGRERANCRA